ncbi:ribosomal protein S7 domain-containing protein [Phakopsora pachyrhizi]|uniref:Ribosomal protein S7 domain-containing protein n=2 Tax=Phakopsora pachyrhizi TaxID=170000 RepID=A0AAV0B3N8_PHAPC|nr:ribosomal protein S7 domain-containing protein [Phakopsora pachyrhizi]
MKLFVGKEVLKLLSENRSIYHSTSNFLKDNRCYQTINRLLSTSSSVYSDYLSYQSHLSELSLSSSRSDTPLTKLFQRSTQGSIRKFSSSRNAKFSATFKNLDRHPRARRLKILTSEPIVPKFPSAEDEDSIRSYVEPRSVNLPTLEEPLIDYMTGLLMRKGKRDTASKHCITLLSHLRLVTGQEPFGLLARAIGLASPLVMTRSESKRIKVTTVPVPLNEIQRARRGILWIVKQSEKRPGKKFGERLAMEVIAVLNGNSEVLKLKAEQHRLALVNRANLRTRVTRA